ncbi:YjbH domain-containing protein [Donghicola mangrovi]|uniref:YjbH domain-containing protein n=1 Tax=Donghicola mangrovi TaxID=2729614 RepID=A0A850Q0C1_9RHOB|nr:YjbH domain-containing protein [Donghicola mangrovi]
MNISKRKSGRPLRQHLMGTIATVGCLIGASAHAGDGSSETNYTIWGTPGLITLPDAYAAPDAEAASTFTYMDGTATAALTFQFTDRISATFRFAGVNGDINPYQGQDTYFDRSFDVRYRILDEGRYLPSVAIGLQDFAGTGLYSGEYVVASKTISPGFSLTGGIGFGRLGSYNPVTTIGDRPSRLISELGRRAYQFSGTGGNFNFSNYFRGDVAPFAGMNWAINDKWRLVAEYSSDAFDAEEDAGFFKNRTPINLSLGYDLGRDSQISAYFLNGDKFGVQATFTINPKHPGMNTGIEEAPLPIRKRAPGEADLLGWTETEGVEKTIRKNIQNGLDYDDLQMAGLEVSAHEATLLLKNARFDYEPQAIGRAARAMANQLPYSIETFHIIPVVNGIATSRITFKRTDLENLQFNTSKAIHDQMVLSDAAGHVPPFDKDQFPDFSWGFSPYMQPGYFDVHRPFRADFGLRLRSALQLNKNFKIAGSATYRLVGDLRESGPDWGGVVPPVRTLGPLFFDDPFGIESLGLYYLGHPLKNIYVRAGVGYLENMYGGVSGEVLWKPVNSPLALGVEVAHVKQRDFDRLFGFRDYEATTGHVSAYYDFGNGYFAELDVGQYLAEDRGATLLLQRTFDNGWVIGGFATKTNISAEDFGEGSFDKGIMFTMPLGFASGKPSRTSFSEVIRPLQRNGGAKLGVRDRLYGQVQEYHRTSLDNEYGRFWR